jgi:predicted transcriptional regulator
MKNKKVKSTTVRLTQEAVDLLELLAADLGVSQTGVIEQAIREMAKRRKIRRSDQSED